MARKYFNSASKWNKEKPLKQGKSVNESLRKRLHERTRAAKTGYRSDSQRINFEYWLMYRKYRRLDEFAEMELKLNDPIGWAKWQDRKLEEKETLDNFLDDFLNSDGPIKPIG